MTYLPQDIFKHILEYTDDRIERKQRRLWDKTRYILVRLEEFTHEEYGWGVSSRAYARWGQCFIEIIQDHQDEAIDEYDNDPYDAKRSYRW